MPISKHAQEARSLLQAERNGTLSTLSKKMAGWPFGSIAPYALTAGGEPLILISEIAEHTRNIRADARVSLLVQESAAIADPQAGGRVTVVGYAMPVTQTFIDDARRRYLDLFPKSASYFEAHDFSLFQIKPTQVRFIGGFGEIYWLEGREMTDASADSSDPLAPHVAMLCDHMNEDHADALRLYATVFAKIDADAAKMIHVDAAGFDMAAIEGGSHKHLRIDFPSPVTTTDEVRAAMVDMVRRARQIVAG